MARILEVKDDVIKVGTDNGGIKEVRRVDVNFEPVVGDRVEVFENESSIMITKSEEPARTDGNSQQGGVNININNANTNATNQGDYVGNGKKVVNKVIYILLALFLGGIGAHKFYAGKIGAGICYLLFCWTFIPGFIALIELIIALCQKSDSNGNILV